MLKHSTTKCTTKQSDDNNRYSQLIDQSMNNGSCIRNASFFLLCFCPNAHVSCVKMRVSMKQQYFRAINDAIHFKRSHIMEIIIRKRPHVKSMSFATDQMSSWFGYFSLFIQMAEILAFSLHFSFFSLSPFLSRTLAPRSNSVNSM